MSIGKRQTVRIISGSKRGSKIQFPEVSGLRPSGDRIRETLFAWLQTSITRSTCLDMFAGSGALGFEAASRGAGSVVMVEKNRTATAALQENATRLKFDDIEIITADALSAALYETRLAKHQFDLVFIDPPFAENLHNKALECVEQHISLAPEARVYIETGKRDADLEVPAHWQQYREKVAGEVRMQLYQT